VKGNESGSQWRQRHQAARHEKNRSEMKKLARVARIAASRKQAAS